MSAIVSVNTDREALATQWTAADLLQQNCSKRCHVQIMAIQMQETISTKGVAFKSVDVNRGATIDGNLKGLWTNQQLALK